MADIKKELNDIKNAVYGREVRGSIHDGIKKINEESEKSKEKADEAHDVMESIIEEGFDNAALEANFEQKLDDKIANLQPEWTGFKEDVTTQLADIEQQKANKSDVNQQINHLENDKADKTYVDYLFTNLDGLQIKGGFDTLNDLEHEHPNGTEGLYVVDDYLYAWNGNMWKQVKELEITPWAEFMTTDGASWEVDY